MRSGANANLSVDAAPRPRNAPLAIVTRPHTPGRQFDGLHRRRRRLGDYSSDEAALSPSSPSTAGLCGVDPDTQTDST